MNTLNAFITVLSGLPLTLLLTFFAFAVGAIIAAPIALGSQSKFAITRIVLRLLVDLVRGIPIIVWLFALKFGLAIGDFHLSSLDAALLGLSIISSAYLAEIYRGGLLAVPKGQVEAADALAIRSSTKYFYVVIPQALKIVSPSVMNYLMSLMKDSSIASTIIVAEMLFQAQQFATEHPTLVGILPYIFAGAIYIAISIPLAIYTRRLDTRIQGAAE